MSMKVKAKGGWKKVTAEVLKGFSDFVSLEELSDYEIIKDSVDADEPEENNESKKKLKKGKEEKKKKQKNKKEKTNVAECDTNEEQQNESKNEIKEGKEGKKKRKRKNRKKKTKIVECDSSEKQPNEDKNENVMSMETEMPLVEETESISNSETELREVESAATEQLNDREAISSKGNLKRKCNLKLSSTAEPATKKIKMILDKDMSKWNGLFVPNQVLENLAEMGFTKPTPIQRECIPAAISDKSDIIAAAETGSGKTLAFGIPLIHHILQCKEQKKNKNPLNGADETEESDKDGEDDAVAGEEKAQDDHPLYAIVLTPTRELAYQIRDHLRSIVKNTGITCQVVVGGLSAQKQSRLLDQHPDIVVATPGRLWDIYQRGNEHLSKLSRISCLVIDEADRMVEKFHFEQLSDILGVVNNRDGSKSYRQTFILSATLTYIPPNAQRLLNLKKKNFHELTEKEKLGELCSQIGIRGKPKVVDLTPKQRTASGLTETRLNFSAVEEKDLYLYCFLREYAGRTIVFANSVECIRRLMSLMTMLERSPLRLYSDMDQKRRLVSLEKFRSNPQGLLLATDVAARGLDIPGIDHVVHYEVPKTTESYIHRSGRTARANSEGFSVLFVGPKEIINYRKLMKALNRDDLSIFPTNDSLLKAARDRVTLARKIELSEYNLKKNKKTEIDRMAEEAGLESEEEPDSDEEAVVKKQADRKSLEQSKKELKRLLNQPFLTHSLQMKYPTKSGQMMWPYLPVAGKGDALRLAAEKVSRKPKKRNKKPKKAQQ